MNRPLFAAMLCALSCAALAQQAPLVEGTAVEPVRKLATPDTVLATRGDAVLLVSDIDAFVAQVPPKDRAAVVATEERVTTLMQNLLLSRQLANDLRKQGLDQNPKVQRELMLATEKVLARHALANYVQSKPQPKLEQLAKETYLSDKSKFVTPEKRTVQHILVNNKDRSDEEAQKRIAQIAAEAAKPGVDFGQLVQQYSDDGSKVQNHGMYDVDESMVGKMDPAFMSAANSLTEVGTMTEPVSGMYGYHLIRLTSYQPSRQLSFEEVRPGLMEQLHMAWMKRMEDEYTEVLRQQNPEVDVEVAEGLKQRYMQTPLSAPPAATAQQ